MTTDDLDSAELRAKHLERQERLATLGTLALGVAHELNTPLSYVIANVDYGKRELDEILRGPLDVDSAALRRRLTRLVDALSDAQTGAEQLRRIVRDVRGFGASAEEEHEPVDLQRVVDSAIQLTAARMRERALVVTSFEPVPRVLAASSRLCQVFINLLANAADACTGRVDENQIRIATRPDADGGALVEVSDTGSGIAPDHLGKIFEAFFTTKAIDEGVGLGLAIAKEIIASFGGTIEVESVLGAGTVFRVRLRSADSDSQGRTSLPGEPTRRGRVLIVDDDPGVLAALRRLVTLHHEVIAVGGGVAALELLRGGARFDVILCDLMMPDLSGAQLHDELSLRMPEMAARIVFITAGAVSVETREFLARVPNETLFKPFDVGVVLAAIRENLD
jgi:nitrogen-specific signal transduction histidine kinase/CheY-like chemotaxis protein